MALNEMLSGMKGNSALNGALGGVAGGALVSAFTNKKSARKLLKTGGLLAMGGLAWQAYSSYRNGQQQRGAMSPPEIPRQQFEAVLSPQNEKPALGLVLQAMIAAAHADQHLSEQEQGQIWQRAMDLGATGSELAALTETMANPPSQDDLVAAAGTLETRIEMYMASCLVIDEECEQGRSYLRQFARRLQLPPPLVEVLHNQANTEPVAA
jgi:uncharacterized membrane protein YebE (DUF533 family)